MPQERMTLEQYQKLMGMKPGQPSPRAKKVELNEYGFIQDSKIDPGGKQRPSKYGAKKTKVDGVTFDSKAEADYYCELKLKQKAGKIVAFCRQPEFILQDGDGTVIRYKPDFIVWYTDPSFELFTQVVEVKGHETPEWRLKEKLFRARFPQLDLLVTK